MNSINSFFEKVYVTTIDIHGERRRDLSARIHNTAFEYFSEVDLTRQEFRKFKNVADYPDSFFEALDLDKNFATRWSTGQLGCFANCIKLYKHALANNYASILVLEDDVQLSDSAFRIFNKAMKQLPEDWDLVFLGYKNGKTHNKAFRWIKKVFYVLKGKDYNDYVPGFFSKNLDKPPKRFAGGFAYGLSKKGIEKLLTYKSPIQEFGDILFPILAHQPGFKAFAVYPQIAADMPFQSSTQQNW